MTTSFDRAVGEVRQLTAPGKLGGGADDLARLALAAPELAERLVECAERIAAEARLTPQPDGHVWWSHREMPMEWRELPAAKSNTVAFRIPDGGVPDGRRALTDEDLDRIRRILLGEDEPGSGQG